MVLTRGDSGLLRALVVVVRLGVEPIDGTADTLQRVDDIINRDGFGLTVLAVRDAVTEDQGESVLQSSPNIVIDRS